MVVVFLKNILNRYIKNLIKNTYYILKHDLQNKLNTTNSLLEKSSNDIKKQYIEYQLLNLYVKIITYFNNLSSGLYEKELSFLKEIGRIEVFPYKQIKSLGEVHSDFDSIKKLPYVIHNNKRLYFPRNWSINDARNYYKYLIQIENILGGDYSEKSPHQYQSDLICVNLNDIIFDIGCAEALFTLNSIDIIKKAFLIESDSMWVDPLLSTFEPFKDKVIIINKQVSELDKNNSISLTSLLLNHKNNNIFIKMDIEGSEYNVIRACQNIISEEANLKFACCTYHNHDDAFLLHQIFKESNYKTQFSEGYMIYINDENLKPPYFRNGIIRAKKEHTT